MSSSPRLVSRVYSVYLGAVLLLVVSMAWLAVSLAGAAPERAQAAALEYVMRRALDEWTTAGRTPESPELSESLREHAQAARTRLTLLSLDGKSLLDSEPVSPALKELADEREFRDLISGTASATRRWERHGGDWWLQVATLWSDAQRRPLAILRASQPTGEFSFSPPLDPRWAAIGLGVLAAVLGAFALHRVFRPLEELSAAAAHVVDAPTLERLPRQTLTELQPVADAFNRLVEQFEERGRTIGRKGTEQEAVLSSMVEGVLAVDSEERIITINRAAAVLIGVTTTEAPGKSLPSIVRNADLRRFVVRALESPASIEDDITLHGQRVRILQATGAALRDARGRAMGAVIVLNDVTHTRHLENIRREFVANVSHELKTPIAGIKGFVETLLDGAMHDPDDAERFLRIIARQADRLDTIIEDLLSLSKIEQSEEAGDLPLERIPLRGVLDAVVEDCRLKAAERQVSLVLDCSEDLIADVNPRLLEQAVINLVDNALKYSESGGRVDLRGELSPDAVVISVRDHGVGIDREHLPRLFERFYRVDKARSRKLGGTGLGLAIVKHIVQAHRGRIDVESVPGQGSVFSIFLPRPMGDAHPPA